MIQVEIVRLGEQKRWRVVEVVERKQKRRRVVEVVERAR